MPRSIWMRSMGACRAPVGLCCYPSSKVHEGARLARRGPLGRFELEPLADKLDRFGQDIAAETDRANGDAGLAANVTQLRPVDGQPFEPGELVIELWPGAGLPLGR
jgi:hypothetical protein